jgi:hypothetical protein
MEGWLYGLFALLGVLAGGLFTYLGMKKQLEQQRELDSCAWRREVRSKPLLKLRDELTIMATKQDKLVAVASQHTILRSKPVEDTKRELQEARDNWNAYIANDDYHLTLLVQYNTGLVNQVEEIWKDYNESLFSLTFPQEADAEEVKKAMRASERNKTKIIEVQELINTLLENL